jgi:transposase
VIWLTHILSEADHRLNHVQPWAERRLNTLSLCTEQPVRSLDFSDDRLQDVLRALSEDERWDSFEGALNQRLLRVYELSPERVRLDSTTASGYWQVSDEGLFQFGHSKDHRPDLPQLKVMLSTLDPLGMPLVTQVVGGQRADDPLYIPAISQVRQSVERKGLLYVGDCKLASLKTRAFVEAAGDFYLCPLPQARPRELEDYLEPVFGGKQELTPIYRPKQDGEQELIAEGYQRQQELSATVDGKAITWTERRLVVRSLKQAHRGKEALLARLSAAQQALEALNHRGRGKRRFVELESLHKAAQAVLERYKLQGLIQLSYEDKTEQRRVRGYGGGPQRLEIKPELRVKATVDEKAVQEAIVRLGWRVYVTNEPGQKLSLSQMVLAYRDEYIIERGFGRLKGKALSLTPMYLQRDDHATGLIRLLSLGLRVLSLVEFGVRRRLGTQGAQLGGLYAGNPKRKTARPTAERLLEAFQELTLTLIGKGDHFQRHLTPLSKLQQRILSLLDFPEDIYTSLCAVSIKPP